MDKKWKQYGYATLAPAGIFSGGSEVHQGRACKGGRRVGVARGGTPDAGEVFKKFVKNKWKIYNFLKISREFRDFFKIF